MLIQTKVITTLIVQLCRKHNFSASEYCLARLNLLTQVRIVLNDFSYIPGDGSSRHVCVLVLPRLFNFMMCWNEHRRNPSSSQ